MLRLGKLARMLILVVGLSLAWLWLVMWEVFSSQDVLAGQLSTLPYSVSIRIRGDVDSLVLVHGTPLPMSASRIFTTTLDNQLRAWVQIYVGNQSLEPGIGGYRCLADLELKPLPEISYAGYVQLQVVISVKPSGELFYSAEEIESKALGMPYASKMGTENIAQPIEDAVCEHDGDEILPFNESNAYHVKLRFGPEIMMIADRKVIIQQEHWGLAGAWVTGGVVWNISRVFADIATRYGDAFDWPGKRVLELGSGTGLIATVLSVERARVLATDGFARACELIENNFIDNLNESELNAVQPSCETFRWQSAEDLERIKLRGPWDVIVGTDLLYPENVQKSIPALLRIFSVFVTDRTVVLLALVEREGVVPQFIKHLNNSAWDVDRIKPDVIARDPHGSKDQIILRMRRHGIGTREVLRAGDPFQVFIRRTL